MVKTYGKLAVVVLAILAVSITYLQTTLPVRAQEEDLMPSDIKPGQPEPGILTVSGQGLVSMQPDTAHIRFGTLTQADTARQAQQDNTAIMSKVLNALKQAGVTEEQMKTTDFALEPVWDYSKTGETGQTPRLVAYRVTNTVQVRTQNLDSIGHLIDVATRSGANNVNRLWFSVAADDEARLEALEKAYQDAFAKAQRLTQAAGVDILGIQSIDEGGMYYPMPEYRSAADMAESTPILPGEQQIGANVTVKFFIQ